MSDPHFIGNFDNSMLIDISEFSKRYQETYLWITLPNEEPTLATFAQQTNNNLSFHTLKYGELVLAQETTCDVQVKWPEIGYFDDEKAAFYLCRLPDRQWKRAPCGRNTTITEPVSNLFFGKGASQMLHLPRMTKAFAPIQYQTIKAAIYELNEKKLISKALNRNFAISFTPYTSRLYILWYNCNPVALIDTKTNIITVEYEHIRQEIIDLNNYKENSSWTIQ